MHQPLRRRMAMASLPALLAAPALLPRPALAQAAAGPGPGTAPTPAPGFYRFRLGGFTVTTVHDGFRDIPLQGFVRNAPLEAVQALLAESFLPTERYRIPFTVTFLDTGRQLVAFDTGNGVTPPGATLGRLPETMRAAGIDPAKVDLVVHSHFHADHINGLLNAEGGRAFPNAEVVVPAAEWAWWRDRGNESRSPEGQRATFANTARCFAPYEGRIRQVAEGAEVIPGLRAIAAPGHTPGHTAYHVADGAAEMIFVADTTNRPEIFARRPDFHAVFDFDADLAEATRRRLFDRIAADRVRITGYHFPFPANGYLAKEGAGYRFVPADWSSAL
ncbi:MBL fold metallo-hydrolase [Roseicella frigidaeris]|nr:MBL fold metallo-hydrolase [Roseicella frigidaeris]